MKHSGVVLTGVLGNLLILFDTAVLPGNEIENVENKEKSYFQMGTQYTLGFSVYTVLRKKYNSAGFEARNLKLLI